jgi:putative ABC transport system permease protein
VSRGRLFEQLFIESAMLSLIAGGAAILLAFWVGSALRALLLPRVLWAQGPIDLRTAVFAFVTSLAVALLVGIAPALQAWATEAKSALKSGTSSASPRSVRFRAALVVAQTALSIVLLAGAGLFVKSLRQVKSIEIGYDIDRTLMASAVSERSLGKDAAVAMPALMERVRRIPGVEAVASAASGPMEGYAVTMLYLPGRDSLPKVGGERGASHLDVSPGYLGATGLRLLAGRDFTAGDRRGLIVNKAMADGWWPRESAIGKCVIRGTPNAPCEPVIGVVENANTMRLMEESQKAQYLVSTDNDPHSVLVVRADPARQAAVGDIVRTEMKRLLPGADYIRVRSMLTNLEPELRPWRLGATLFTAMGVLALIVAAIGVYSVVAYAVSQRTNEMGIRIALGAGANDVIRLVLGSGLRTVAIGVVAGVLVTLALGRLVASLLYGTSARDPWILAGAAAVLLLIGVAASMIPALRASRVDPISALRRD